MSLKDIADFSLSLKTPTVFLEAFAIIAGVIESLKVFSVFETLKVITTAHKFLGFTASVFKLSEFAAAVFVIFVLVIGIFLALKAITTHLLDFAPTTLNLVVLFWSPKYNCS